MFNKGRGAIAGSVTTDDFDMVNGLLTGLDQSATDPVDIATTTKFRSGKFGIANPANTFRYSVLGSAITADRNVTLPLLTANDTLAVLAENQTFTGVKWFYNDNIRIRSNDGAGNYGRFRQFPITADRGLNIPSLTATDTIVFEAHPATLTGKSMDYNTNTFTNFPTGGGGATSTTNPFTTKKIWALWMPGGGTSGTGMNSGLTSAVGAGSLTYTSTGKYLPFVSAVVGTAAGNRGNSGAGTVRALQNYFVCRFKVSTLTAQRTFVGFINNTTGLITGSDDFLSSNQGIALTYRAGTDTNWQIAHNDNAGSTVFVDTGVAVAANTITLIQFRAPAGDTGFQWALNAGAWSSTITADVPASTTALMPFMQIDPTEAVSKTIDGYYWYVEQGTGE